MLQKEKLLRIENTENIYCFNNEDVSNYIS